jgi:surface protein
MFEGCETINALPNISNWNTDSLTDINHMFYLCTALAVMPDISRWNISKVN